MSNLAITYVITVAALLILRIIMGILTGGKFTFRRLILGKDNGLSVSQLQAAFCTIIVLAAYIAVYSSNFLLGQYNPIINIPGNLLILAGLSYATYVGAGSITQTQLERSYQEKTGVAPPTGEYIPKETDHSGSPGDLVNTDENQTDLTKFQLIAWNLVAAVIFWIALHQSLDHFLAVSNAAASLNFPDIDQTLLALVGIGQGTYIANKALKNKATAAVTTISGVPAVPGVTSVGRKETTVVGGTAVIRESTTLVTGLPIAAAQPVAHAADLPNGIAHGAPP